MSTHRHPVNPLFNPPESARRSTHRAVKFVGDELAEHQRAMDRTSLTS